MLYWLFVTKAYIERVKTLEQTLPLIAEQMNPVSGRTKVETISVFIADHPVVRYGVSLIEYYNRARPSQAIHAIPDPYPELQKTPPQDGTLIALPVLGGIQHDYRLAA